MTYPFIQSKNYTLAVSFEHNYTYQTSFRAFIKQLADLKPNTQFHTTHTSLSQNFFQHIHQTVSRSKTQHSISH